MEDNIDNVTKWVTEYYAGYHKFMSKHHLELYNKFYNNIFPPQSIGACVMIGKGSQSDEDYNEIIKISKEFCETYENPRNFPLDF